VCTVFEREGLGQSVTTNAHNPSAEVDAARFSLFFPAARVGRSGGQ
jgi:hypothetical protein